ncbi:amine dehydrogenase large subunit [Salinisphaera orenii]|uniref:Amine dehydrogenase n=1 Tax=Salinisphaera orenii YIM 95161 TaxID=1051139 RepID=A0A423PUW5_9GAMM|nr:amine dehydrogenase large subunit [Salinisphaera halophila]ROO29351.1 amine dehydrogenase [Salinisphaera halophila YIM 95161]
MKIKFNRARGGLVWAALAVSAAAWGQLPPDTIGTTKLDPPGPHRAYIIDTQFDNATTGKVVVVDPEKKKMLGMIPTGYLAPSVLSNNDKTLYSADTFWSRGVRGERTDVLTAWDTRTLEPRWEVEIPEKRANILIERYMLTVSDDDRFVYVYNFTPAPSVTVVDTENREVASEIDIAGCALNYPTGDRSFASICGDGSFQQVRLDDEGHEISRMRTRFFQPNHLAMNERAVRNGDTYYFVTLDGHIQPIDVSGTAPEVGERWSLFTEAQREAGWGVGGWQLMAISPALDRLYVLVHPDHSDRNWEDPSNTIWAYDLDTHEKVGEMKTENYVWSLRATRDDAPLLLGININGGLDVFDLTTSEYMHTVEGISDIPALVLSH